MKSPSLPTPSPFPPANSSYEVSYKSNIMACLEQTPSSMFTSANSLQIRHKYQNQATLVPPIEPDRGEGCQHYNQQPQPHQNQQQHHEQDTHDSLPVEATPNPQQLASRRAETRRKALELLVVSEKQKPHMRKYSLNVHSPGQPGNNPTGQLAKRTSAGCKTCKVRRVKCDQTLPSCLRCTRYYGASDMCDYVGSNIQMGSSSSGQAEASSSSSAAVPGSSSFQVVPQAAGATMSDPSSAFGTSTVPQDHTQVLEIANLLGETFTMQDIRRAMTYEVNRLSADVSLNLKVGMNTLLTYLETDEAHNNAAAGSLADYLRQHTINAMSEVRKALAQPDAINNSYIQLTIVRLFWVANALGDAAAADTHLRALATILQKRGRSQIIGAPCPVPTSTSNRLRDGTSLADEFVWKIDPITGTVDLPRFMIPTIGPLTPGQRCVDLAPAGIKVLYNRNITSLALTTFAGCVQYLLQLRAFAQSNDIAESLARDIVRYQLVISWAFTGYVPRSEFEEVIFMSISLAYFSVAGCQYQGYHEHWVRKTYEILAKILSRPQPGRFAKDQDVRSWFSQLLRMSVNSFSQSRGTAISFTAISLMLQLQFFWHASFDETAQPFWDRVFSNE